MPFESRPASFRVPIHSIADRRALERRIVVARRLAHQGQTHEAVETFAGLMPSAEAQLGLERQLRFFALYWQALRAARCTHDVERLRGLTEAQASTYERLRDGLPEGQSEPTERVRHFCELGILALFDLARRVGVDSGPGQTYLALGFRLLGAYREEAYRDANDPEESAGTGPTAQRTLYPSAAASDQRPIVVERQGERFSMVRIGAES